RLLDHPSDPNSPSNADGFLTTERLAVLLDGASPRGSARVSAEADDAVWLVCRFLDELSPGARQPGADVRALVEAARKVLKREYDELCSIAGLVPAERPFACFAIAELDGTTLQLFNMGDLTTLVRSRDGSVERFG